MSVIGREARPMIIDRVSINSNLWTEDIPASGNDIVFTWVNRNRLTQTKIVKNSTVTVDVEQGTTVVIKVYSRSGTLLNTYSGLTGVTWTYTVAMQATDTANSETGLTFLIYTIRNGYSSYKAITMNVKRPTYTVPTNNPTYTLVGLPQTNIPAEALASIVNQNVTVIESTVGSLSSDVSSVYSDLITINSQVIDHETRIGLLE